MEEFEYYFNGLDTGLSVSVMVISLILGLILLVANWKIFEKAGEGGWKVLIPIYNLYIYFKITFGNGWMFLLTLVPVVNIVITLIAAWKLCKAFGKGVGFFILMILIPFLANLILGFGSAEYNGPA